MKKVYPFLLAVLFYMPVHAQTYTTRDGRISFYSKTPMEDIKAENKQVFAAVDLTKKSIAFTLLMRSFLFEKQLMQDHFNENYAESDKFPKASFSGTITGNVSSTPGTYNVQVQGNLTIHGVTQPITAPAVLTVQTGKLSGKTSFTVKPEDYGMKIPAVVKEKIAKQISVEVAIDNCTARP